MPKDELDLLDREERIFTCFQAAIDEEDRDCVACLDDAFRRSNISLRSTARRRHICCPGATAALILPL